MNTREEWKKEIENAINDYNIGKIEIDELSDVVGIRSHILRWCNVLEDLEDWRNPLRMLTVEKTAEKLIEMCDLCDTHPDTTIDKDVVFYGFDSYDEAREMADLVGRVVIIEKRDGDDYNFRWRIKDNMVFEDDPKALRPYDSKKYFYGVAVGRY